MMKRRFLSVVIAMVMILSLFPFYAFAAEWDGTVWPTSDPADSVNYLTIDSGKTLSPTRTITVNNGVTLYVQGGGAISGGTAGVPLFDVKSGGTLVLDNIEITGNAVGNKGAVYVENGGTLQIEESVKIDGNTYSGSEKNLVIAQNATVTLTTEVTKPIGFSYDSMLTKPVSAIKGSNLYDVQESDLASNKLHFEGSSEVEAVFRYNQVILHSSKIQVLFWSPLFYTGGLNSWKPDCVEAITNSYSRAETLNLSDTSSTNRQNLPNNIDKYDFIFIWLPTTGGIDPSKDYYDREIEQLVTYLNDGGRIFIQAEHPGHSQVVNGAIRLATACGAEFTIATHPTPTNTTCIPGNSSLSDGITGFNPYMVAPIVPNAGEAYDVVFYTPHTDGNNYAWMVDQQAGVRSDGKKFGRITVSTDVNCWGTSNSNDSYSTEAGIKQFVTKLFEDSYENRLAAAAGYNPNVAKEIQAKIGENEYQIVQNALDIVKPNETIVLQRDNSLTAVRNKPLLNTATIQQANGGSTFKATTADTNISVSSTGAITLHSGELDVSANGALALTSGHTVTSAAPFHVAAADTNNNTYTNPGGASVTATTEGQTITVTTSAGKTYTFTATNGNETFYIGEYNVTYSLSGTAINGTTPDLPFHTSTYKVTLKPAANYTLSVSNVTVTMGGTELTDPGVCTQDGDNVKVTVPNVNDNIVITANGVHLTSDVTVTITGDGKYTAKDTAGNAYTPDAAGKVTVPRGEQITFIFAPTDAANPNPAYQNEPDTFSVLTELANGVTSVFNQNNWNWTDKTYTYTFTPTAETHTLAATFQKRHTVRVYVSNGAATLPSGFISTTEGSTYCVLVPHGDTPAFTFTADPALGTTPVVENAFWKLGDDAPVDLTSVIKNNPTYTTPEVTAPAYLSVTFVEGETVTVSVTGGSQQIPTGESWTAVSTTDTTTVKERVVERDGDLAITVMPEENTVIRTLKLDTTDRDPETDLADGTLVKNADGSYTFYLKNIETHHEVVFEFVNYGTLSSTTSTVTVTDPVPGITYEIFDKSGNKVGEGVSGDGSEIVFPGLPSGKPYTVKAIDGKPVTVGPISTKPTSQPKPDDPDDTGISDWLITNEHPVYLNGYPSGVFAPDDDMTRAEAAQMFYNLLLNKDVPVTVAFTDVPAGAWYEKAVHTLGSIGVIQGVGNDRFAPEDSITRAEFTAMAMRFTKQATGGENIFSDVTEDAWYYDYVVGSIRYGWIGGYPDGTFRPQNNITRAEVAAIVNRMLARVADETFIRNHPDRLRQFTDLSDAHWAYLQILEASTPHKYTKPNNVERWQ